MEQYEIASDGTIEVNDIDLMCDLLAAGEYVSSDLCDHGCEVTHLVRIDGNTYLVTVLEHHERGRDLYDQMPLTLTPAKQVQVTTWVPA